MTETGSEVTRVIQSREEIATDATKASLGLIGERGGHGPNPGPASEHPPLLDQVLPTHGPQGTARLRAERDSRVGKPLQNWAGPGDQGLMAAGVIMRAQGL